MAVHAGPVVAEDRLGHEGGSLAVAPGDALDDVLELHHVVGTGHQLAEAEVDLCLTRGAHLVVLTLDEKSGRFELAGHLSS